MAMNADMGVEAVKVSPPASYIGATLMGVPMEHWVSALTIIYMALLIGHFVFKRWREWKKWVSQRRGSKES